MTEMDERHAMKRGFMRGNSKSKDDLRPEYDFASMKGGVRGKYVKQYRAGTNLVLLDPDLAAAFPTDMAVNRALHAVLTISQVVRLPNKRLRRIEQKRPL